jgi:hypothetical protein
VKQATKARLIAIVGGWIVKLLCATLRFRVSDPTGFLKLPTTVRMTGIFWHNRLFIVPWFFTHYMCPRRSSALTSPSKDGEILAAFLARFGIGAIRGSSSRGGTKAVFEMKRAAEAGHDIAITPDGPRGPKYRLNPGVIALAQVADIQVLPVIVHYTRFWELKSWDAFRIPKPFSVVNVEFLALEKIPQTESDEAFEVQRLRLEQIMRDAHHVEDESH